MNSSVISSTFTMLCNPHLHLVLKHFHHTQVQGPFSSDSPPSPTPSNHQAALDCMDLSILAFIQWDHSISDFCAWFPSRSMLSRFIHSFLWLTNFHGMCMPWFFIHSSVDTPLHSFDLLATPSSAPWVLVFGFLGDMPRSGIVESCGYSVFNFLRNYLIIFHRVWTIFCSHQQHSDGSSFSSSIPTLLILHFLL